MVGICTIKTHGNMATKPKKEILKFYAFYKLELDVIGNLTKPFESKYHRDLQSLPIQMRATILYLANPWMDFKMLFTTNIFLYLVKFLLLTFPLISQFIAHF